MARTIETRETIEAPPATVWSVLTDMDAMGEWNPFIREMSGELREGGTLRIHVVPPGQKGGQFTPRVLSARPNEELRWRGSLPVPGLFVGEHYFQLSPATSGTLLVHGERFSGLLIPLMSNLLRDTERGFHAMNAALKERAERISEP